MASKGGGKAPCVVDRQEARSSLKFECRAMPRYVGCEFYTHTFFSHSWAFPCAHVIIVLSALNREQVNLTQGCARSACAEDGFAPTYGT